MSVSLQDYVPSRVCKELAATVCQSGVHRHKRTPALNMVMSMSLLATLTPCCYTAALGQHLIDGSAHLKLSQHSGKILWCRWKQLMNWGMCTPTLAAGLTLCKPGMMLWTVSLDPTRSVSPTYPAQPTLTSATLDPLGMQNSFGDAPRHTACTPQSCEYLMSWHLISAGLHRGGELWRQAAGVTLQVLKCWRQHFGQKTEVDLLRQYGVAGLLLSSGVILGKLVQWGSPTDLHTQLEVCYHHTSSPFRKDGATHLSCCVLSDVQLIS